MPPDNSPYERATVQSLRGSSDRSRTSHLTDDRPLPARIYWPERACRPPVTIAAVKGHLTRNPWSATTCVPPDDRCQRRRRYLRNFAFPLVTGLPSVKPTPNPATWHSAAASVTVGLVAVMWVRGLWAHTDRVSRTALPCRLGQLRDCRANYVPHRRPRSSSLYCFSTNSAISQTIQFNSLTYLL